MLVGDHVRDSAGRGRRMEEIGHWHHMKARLKIAEELNLIEGESLIDAGCGSGRYLIYFKKHHKIPYCVGMDVSKDRIILAKHNLRKHNLFVELVVADIENSPFKSSSFDIVFSADVVEHVPNPFKGINEMVRISKDKIIIATPNKLCPIDMSKIAQIFSSHVPPPIENYLTKFQLKRMLIDAGIKPSNIIIKETSFIPFGWLFVHVKISMSIKLLRLFLTIEKFLEKTPIKNIAGVLVAHAKK
jgi:ubiquinone/menaquinone biosynthesis C-methylase UbiE